MAVKSIRTYGVYVIQLDDDPLHVYVGHTSHSFKKRLNQHNSGLSKNFAGRVFIRGARGILRPELYKQYKRTLIRDEAIIHEGKVAKALKNQGYKVESDQL